MHNSSSEPIKRVVIVGGGSAGWITAGLLAGEHGPDLSVTLIESPDVGTIGVGEGTWPTMRTTLRKIGIPESDFLTHCNASFKQGTRFAGWVDGKVDDRYYHPFSAPAGYNTLSLVPHWQPKRDSISFVDAVSAQGRICDADLAPKQASTPEYAAVVNYGYHLDAGRFAELLQRHCTGRLGVVHVLDHVTGINAAADGDVHSISTRTSGDLEADLFVDCTGFASLLLGKHYEIPWLDRHQVLFNDSALAAQVPYPTPASPIASQTISTARSAGWIWDIGLTTRRGIGYTYSSAHSTDEEAGRVLADYIERMGGVSADGIEPRKISFRSGHRETFWHRNCVAVGMSAGFLEPLEASALVMIELSARMISDDLPATRATMEIVARRYNETFRYRWDRIIDFLKLHYVLSRRDDSDYWRDHRMPTGIPGGLAELLDYWKYQLPSSRDFTQAEEIFSSASYQYVLYGMGFETTTGGRSRFARHAAQAERLFAENARMTRQLLGNLPDNRQLLTQIGAEGLPRSDAA
jgi:glycine/D-amino acid oxidase-like deaminating enzyme